MYSKIVEDLDNERRYKKTLRKYVVFVSRVFDVHNTISFYLLF